MLDSRYIDEVVPAAVFLAIRTTEIQTKLDSVQMNALAVMMMEYQQFSRKLYQEFK